MLVLAIACWVLFIGIILGIVWLVRKLFRLGDAKSAGKGIKRRYGAGEIDKEEYESIKRDVISSHQ